MNQLITEVFVKQPLVLPGSAKKQQQQKITSNLLIVFFLDFFLNLLLMVTTKTYKVYGKRPKHHNMPEVQKKPRQKLFAGARSWPT